MLLQPESRGFVSLRSNDPTAAPVIQPNYMSTENDRLMLVKGFKLVKDIMLSNAFNGFRINNINFPKKSDSDDAILAINENCKTENSPFPSPQLRVQRTFPAPPLRDRRPWSLIFIISSFLNNNLKLIL